MAGEFSIASFNLHNFNYDVRVGGTGADFQFRKAKCEHVSEIIRDGGYDVIALQEVQTPETVASLVRQLNNGNPDGRYAFVHCHDFYETISNGRFKSPGREKRGELAFIYDSESVSLFKAWAVYKRLNDRMWLALDYFISGAAALLATSLGVGAFVGDEDDDDDPKSEQDNNKRNKTNQKPRVLKTVGALGVAGAGYAAHKLLESQLKRMRPPFVAFFCKKTGGKIDESRQLRLINVHSQFSRSRNEFFDKFQTPSQIRTKEAEFVLREAFQIVKSEQVEGVSLALTMACGDFNCSASQLQKIAETVNVKHYDPLIIGVVKDPAIPKAHLTTVSNKKEAKEGRPWEYHYVHDFDHFVFDMDVWTPNDAKRAFGLEHEKFFVLEGKERRALSDHLPVVIKTVKF